MADPLTTRRAAPEDVPVEALANKAMRENLEPRPRDADIDAAMDKIKSRYGDVLARLGR